MATKKEKPFRTILDPPVEIATTSGEEIEDVIAMRINEDGVEEFYVSGKTNVFEKIQAESHGTRIEEIIAKVLATGDATLLNQKKGEFMDLTEMPENIFEAQQRITEAEKTFKELPIEVRNAYNNNFNEYLKDVGSDKWLKLVGLTKETPEEEKTPEPEKGEKEE